MKVQLNCAKHPYYQSGYAAIVSVLVIVATTIVIGLGVANLSLTSLLSSWQHTQDDSRQAMLDTCVELALIDYNRASIIGASLSAPNLLCTYSDITPLVDTLSFRIVATQDNSSREANVVVSRNSSVSIVEWQYH